MRPGAVATFKEMNENRMEFKTWDLTGLVTRVFNLTCVRFRVCGGSHVVTGMLRVRAGQGFTWTHTTHALPWGTVEKMRPKVPGAGRAEGRPPEGGVSSKCAHRVGFLEAAASDPEAG